MTYPQRLHSLDNLRAVMMWLGIVLHTAVNHLAGESPLPWRDPQTTLVADLTLIFIHTFRVPVFFILAGFFVAMLVQHRGYGGMLMHRMRRLGLPFLMFWPPVFIGTVLLIVVYAHLMATGTVGFDPTLIKADPARPMFNTMHMWFIYYLLWFCVCTALAGIFSKRTPSWLKQSVASGWLLLASKWWGFMVLALPLALVGSFYKAGIVTTSGSFIPQLGEFVQSGLFFVFGWYLYRHQESLLDLYSRYCWACAAAGLVFLAVFLGLIGTVQANLGKIPHSQFWLAFVYNCASWLWSFALIGMFVKYLPSQNRFLRYVSESSYWVYLVHMLGTLGFGVMLYNAPFNALTKMGVNIFATTVTCLATYHLLVRFSPVGVLLTGQQHAAGSRQKFNKGAQFPGDTV